MEDCSENAYKEKIQYRRQHFKRRLSYLLLFSLFSVPAFSLFSTYEFQRLVLLFFSSPHCLFFLQGYFFPFFQFRVRTCQIIIFFSFWGKDKKSLVIVVIPFCIPPHLPTYINILVEPSFSSPIVFSSFFF